MSAVDTEMSAVDTALEVAEHSEHGLRTYRIDEIGSIGLDLEVRKKGPIGKGKQLVITHVRPGSLAERLQMPTNASLTGINGAALPADSRSQYDSLMSAILQQERPIYISVYVKPPAAASAPLSDRWRRSRSNSGQADGIALAPGVGLSTFSNLVNLLQPATPRAGMDSPVSSEGRGQRLVTQTC